MDETVVEEFLELKDEINKAILSDDYSLLVSKNKIAPITDIDKLQVPQMKGWLFNFYLLIDDFDRYDRINHRLLEYWDNIRDAALVEDIALRNSMILDWRN